jgi:hypothetical protein
MEENEEENTTLFHKRLNKLLNNVRIQDRTHNLHSSHWSRSSVSFLI